MIELKLYVSEIDYDAVLRQFGGAVGGAAVIAAKALPDSAKEDFAVKYLNGSSEKLAQMLEDAAAAKGIRLKVSGAQAAAVKQP